jgi:hypothetical protein
MHGLETLKALNNADGKHTARKQIEAIWQAINHTRANLTATDREWAFYEALLAARGPADKARH